MLRRSLDHGTGVRGRYIHGNEGTGKQIGGRRNENATMNVRSYEVEHDKQLKNMRNIESGEIAKQVKEKRLKWYGQVMTREVHYVGRRVMGMEVQGRRKRGRPIEKWLDETQDHIKEKGLSADEVYNRSIRRRMSLYIDPASKWE